MAGPDALADALPLLQRIALTRETRAALDKDKGLLTAIREQIVELEPGRGRARSAWSASGPAP